MEHTGSELHSGSESRSRSGSRSDLDLDPECNYIYDLEITDDAPCAKQPDKITIKMKPHQLASLHKAILLETHGMIRYNVRNCHRDYIFRGPSVVKTNIGILGDAIGSGKTLIALSIIATSPTIHIKKPNETIISYGGRNNNGYMCTTLSSDNVGNNSTNSQQHLKTTLMIVPHGPVFNQFIATISTQTTLRVLTLDSITTIKRIMPTDTARLRGYLEDFDVVLVKNTILRQLHEHYSGTTILNMWDRIMIDEAADILNTVPLYSYRILWLISATYAHIPKQLNTNTIRNHISATIYDIFSHEQAIHMLTVKCSDEFIMKSFNIPEPIVKYYICELPHKIAVVQSFLSPKVRERIDANDFVGALSLVGATIETESNIIDIITAELERDIRNKRKELLFIQELDLPTEVIESRLVAPQLELVRLEEKLKNVIERVTCLEEKSCGVCFEHYQNPLLLPCNHIFCAKCLVHWMQHNHQTCPTCRSKVQSDKLVSIVKEKQDASNTSHTQDNTIKSKEDTLIDIISANPEGKFVVFSTFEGYWTRAQILESNKIRFGMLRGNSNIMRGVIDRFKNGSINVLFLNTSHTVSGIDISCATDMILIQDLGQDRLQAIGRCNRYPRTTVLRIHQLCFPHELYIRPRSQSI